MNDASLKKTFLAFSLVLATRAAAGAVDARSQAIHMRELKSGRETVLLAENRNLLGPAHLSLDFTARDNVRISVGLPLQAVLAPGEKRELLRVGPADPQFGFSYRVSLQEGFGDPLARHDAGALYLLPWEHGQKHGVGQGYFGSYTHQKIRALDFDMPLGTKLCAARDGRVVAVREDSDRGGADPKFARDSNYIDILHADGSWATYAHLKKGGALVRFGQRVQAGEVIGLSGATGQAAGPHLHFSVQKASFGPESETLPTSFMLPPGGSQGAQLLEGRYYYSWHPGGPDFARVSAEDLDEAALSLKAWPVKDGKLSFPREKLDNRDLIYCANGTDKNLEVTFELGKAENARASQGLPYTRRVAAGTKVFLLSVLMESGHSAYQCRFSSRQVP
jgi:murein DD-endopeptidase MepM/ murein hydrolase activator NlpD